MNNTFILLKAGLLNSFAINEMLAPESKNRKGAIILSIGILCLVIFIGGYNVLTSIALVQSGAVDIIPAYMVSVTSFSVVFLTMFKTNGVLFGYKDFDMLMGLPVKSSAIIASRFLFMYLLNYALCFVFIIPSSIVWALAVPNGLAQFLLLFVCSFFVPIIPMCIASFLGIGIIMLSSKFKSRNIVSLLLTFGVIAGILYLGMSANAGTGELTSVSVMLAGMIYKMYPLSSFFSTSFIMGQTIGIFCYMALTLCVILLFIKLIAPRYSLLNAIVVSSNSNRQSKKTIIKVNSIFVALYKKEMSRFLGSYTYMLNTGIGLFALLVISLLCLFVNIDTVGTWIGMPNFHELLSKYAPLVVSAFLALSCTTSSSISLEGNNLWILQSVPVPKKTIIKSKLAINLSLHLVATFICIAVMFLKIKFSFIDTVFLIVVPISYSIFTSVVGIFINDKFPNFNWTTETTVVKQSIAVILSMITILATIALPALIIVVMPAFAYALLMLITCAGLLGISALLYYKMANKDIGLNY